MLRLTSAILWTVVLLLACSGAVTLCLLTSPVAMPDGRRDFFDSPYLFASFVVLAAVSALAAWLVPREGLWWGVLAASPFYVVFLVDILAGHKGGEGQGLWPVGLIFLLGLTLIPAVAAFVTSLIAARTR